VEIRAASNQVDQSLFNRFGGRDGVRSKLESALALRVDDLERVFGLTASQKKKLEVAGSGDVKRFFDRVDVVKRRFAQMQFQPNNNVWQEARVLQLELEAGIFGDGSIFAKTISKTLDAEQRARYEILVRERFSGRRRAAIDCFVAILDKNLGLSDRQRSRLVELVVEHTPAPRRFGRGDYFFLMYQLSQLPPEKLQSIFDAPQWRLLHRQFDQAQAMEPWLRANGVLGDDTNVDPRDPLRRQPVAPAGLRAPAPRGARGFHIEAGDPVLVAPVPKDAGGPQVRVQFPKK
jgi:hypothetical protein